MRYQTIIAGFVAAAVASISCLYLSACSKPPQPTVSVTEFNALEDRVAKLEAKRDMAPAAIVQEQPATPQALLVVTAVPLLGGSYQRSYATMAICETARSALEASDAERIQQLQTDEADADARSGVRNVIRFAPPRLSVVCLPA